MEDEGDPGDDIDIDSDDPDLLAELNSMENDDPELHDEFKSMGLGSDVEELDEDQLEAELEAEERGESKHREAEPTPEVLQQTLDELKTKAVALKKAGKMDEAKAAMVQIQALRDKIEGRGPGIHDKLSMISQASTAKVERIQAIQENHNEARGSGDEVRALLRKRFAEYQAAASACGEDKASAIRCLQQTKHIRSLLADIDQGKVVSLLQVPPSPGPSLSGQPVKPSLNSQSQPASSTKQYDMLEQAVQERVSYFEEKTKSLFLANEKILALEYNRIKKEVLSVLDELQKARQQGLPPPQVIPQTKTFTKEARNTRLAAHELEMVILGCSSLSHSSLKGSEIASYISWVFECAAEEQKGSSPVGAKTANPDFNHTAKLKIDRTPAAVKKWKYMKINLEVWHHRTLWKHTLIGNCVVKLHDLLTKADLSVDTKLKLDGKFTGK